MINSWGEYIVMAWRARQLAAAVDTSRDVPPPSPSEFVSVDTVLAAATAAVPDKELYYVASPGSFMSSMHHYSVFLRGATPRTEFLLHPVLVDARTGKVTGSPEMPAHISALMLCQPLHFGNYGGMPLKIIWAAFDLATIALLVTGL